HRTDDRHELARVDVYREVALDLDVAIDRIVGEPEVAHLDQALERDAGSGGEHQARLHGMTMRPIPPIAALEPRPSTPMQIMPSAMSGYCTSEYASQVK